MDLMLMLAQGQALPDPEKTIGWGERVIAGGVPLICLMVAVIAVIAAVFQYKKNADLEASYRADLDARAKKAEADSDKRLAEAKVEAKERAQEIDKLQRERLASEKESDTTLAAAVRMVERCTDVLVRVERKLA